MRASKFVLIPLIVLLLIVVSVLAALLFVNPAVFRGQLEARAAIALGRHVQLDGPIRLERSLRPQIVIEDITIGNPDWATGAHFAKAEKISVRVALFPLLRGDLRILDVSFTGVELFIEEAPEGSNNYTFGDGGNSDAPGVLPPIEQLQVRDVIINYQTADAGTSSYKVAEARLWNIPGQPERIEGKGFAKGMPFNILLAADIAAELSSPQNPWSLKLDLKGPDMTLTLAGRMAQAFKYEKGDYHITLSGKQADSLESLFDVEFPTTGPFEISWALNVDENSYRLTDLAAHVRGPSGTPEIQVSKGEASGGNDVPLQIALQGQYGDVPFTFTFASAHPFEGTTQTTPWPIEAQLSIADTKLNFDGSMIPAIAAERLAFDVRLQGETLFTLARILDTELPKAGPYQFSFHTQVAGGNYTLTDLKGTLENIELWKTVQIVGGEASVLESGSVMASLDAKLDSVPLSLSFQGGPGASGKTGATIWPFKLEAVASGTTLKGDGSVATTEKLKALQIATRIKGNRFEALGPLIGISLPAMGKFEVSADISSSGHVYEASNLAVQLGTNRLTGSLRWEDKAPRPFLTGKLSLDRLTLGALFDTASKPSSKPREAGLLDRPIKLDGLKEFDAKLDLFVKRVADGSISIADVKSAVTLANGELSAPFRASLAGAPLEGQIRLRQRKNVPNVSLKTTIGRIDVGQTLRQLEFPESIVGTADTIFFDGSSTGKTLLRLYEQAAFTLQIKPAKLSYTAKLADQTVDVMVENAEFVARKDRPLTGSFSGTLQDVPFNATAGTGTLAEILRADVALPVRLALQTADVQLKVEGNIAKPFQSKTFEIDHELTGKEIKGLDSLFDFVIPLRGAFRAQGRLTARGNRFTYEENLRVGKSDLKANITVLRGPTRAKIMGSIFASQIHLDDMELFGVNKDAAPNRDKSRVIPDYTLPLDVLLTVDLELDIKVERIEAGVGVLGDFGDLVSLVSLKDGRFKSTTQATGFSGARLNSEFELNAAADPPMNKILFNAKDIDGGLLLKLMGVTEIFEGQLNLYVDLIGPGYTRRKFLGNADGRIAVVGGPGKISSRMVDLWAADLFTTMLSPQWQRQAVTEMNCMAMHIELKEGLAEIDDILLDTQRITVAGSGILDLETEALNLIIAPRPKRASLVSLANPVRIEGTLSKPEVSVTRLPRRRRLAGSGAGIFAGLVNPAFLLLAFADTGTGGANPCDAAAERAYEAIGAGSQ